MVIAGIFFLNSTLRFDHFSPSAFRFLTNWTTRTLLGLRKKKPAKTRTARTARTVLGQLGQYSDSSDSPRTARTMWVSVKYCIQLRKQRSAIPLPHWFPMQFFVSPVEAIRNIYWRRPKSLTTTRRLLSPRSTLFITRYWITGSLPLMAMMSALSGLSQTLEKRSILPLRLLLSTASDCYFWSKSSPHQTSM